jgi:hypothetical protein
MKKPLIDKPNILNMLYFCGFSYIKISLSIQVKNMHINIYMCHIQFFFFSLKSNHDFVTYCLELLVSTYLSTITTQ